MIRYELHTNGVAYSGTLKELQEMGRMMKSEYVIYKYHRSRANDGQKSDLTKWMTEKDILDAKGMLARGYKLGTLSARYHISKDLLGRIIKDWDQRHDHNGTNK